MVKVLFIVRRTRSKAARHIVYCRLTSNQQTREISTEQEISDPELWDQNRQLYNKPGAEGEFINLFCEKLKYDIKTTYLKLNDGTGVSPSRILQELRKPAHKPVPVHQLVSEYIAWCRANLQRSEDTVAHYDTYLENLKAFEGASPLYPEDLTLAMAQRFKSFLRTDRVSASGKRITGCKKKTRASRHVEFFKTALDHAVKEKKIATHELQYYTAERDRMKEVVFLDAEERAIWFNASFKNRILQENKDLMTFQIATGVSYGNIWEPLEVKYVPGVGKLLVGSRIKGSKSKFYLPFTKLAEEILEKYNWKLPYYDNSTYNKTIKLIAEFLGIRKHLTTHTGRKTFSMMMRANGYSIPAIKDMLGHSTTRTTETYYMGDSAERVINEMATLHARA